MPHLLPTAKAMDTRDEKARRAVYRFRQMLPTLTGYAQALTGRKDIYVELSTTSNGETDGNKIMMRPPLALGEDLPHESRKCDKRDRRTLQLKCAACHQREQVILPIKHEIAHNAFKTFLKPESDDIDSLVEDTVRISGSRYARAVAKRLDEPHPSYLNLAVLVGEWMQPLLNALEDSRVDSEMFRAEPGVRVMYHASLNRIRDVGIESQDPRTGAVEYVRWDTQPIDYQAIFACYCVITKYNYEGWFHPDVDEAMQDETLRDLLVKVRRTRSVKEVYRLCFPIMERLRELGFCRRPDDPEEEPDPEDTEPEENTDEADGPADSQPDGGGHDSLDGGGPGGSGTPPGKPSAPEDEQRSDGEGSPSDDAPAPEGSPSDEDDAGSGERDDDAPSGDGDDPAGDAASDGNDLDDAASGSGDHAHGDDTPGESGEDASSAEVPGEDEPIDEGPARPEPGEPEDFEDYILKAGGHDEPYLVRVGILGPEETNDDDKAIIIAILQGLFFDQPSRHVSGVAIYHHSKNDPDAQAWNPRMAAWFGQEFDVPESTLGASLLKMRRAFTDNQQHRQQRDLRSGRVDARVLGRRAATDDDRLFYKRTIVAKKNYKVLIGLDVSGSTSGRTVGRIKRAAMAQAELCHRVGIDFAVYAHTGGDSRNGGVQLEIYVIKEFGEPWNNKTKQRLRDLYASNFNLDGHTLEFYRKTLDRVQGTDKVLVYYTDGAMPAENHDEELAILLREIRKIRQLGYTHLFVGVENDEPKRKYGLDMVRLDDDPDIPKVVEQLGRRLART